MNLIYQLQYTECNAFYIGETCCSLSDYMNGHRFTTTVVNPDLELPSTHNPTRSLSKNAGLSVSYTSYQTPPSTRSTTNLKLHTNSSSNHNTPPDSTSVNPPPIPPMPQWHLQSLVSLFYSAAVEGHGVLDESLHLFLFHLYILVTLTCRPDNAIVCLR